MSFLRNLLNPPPTHGELDDYYNFFNSVNSGLEGLTSVINPTVLVNPNFSILATRGLTPTTQADGDNTEFIGSWFVFGASNATYNITPSIYAANSTVQSASLYYVNTKVITANGDPFYFYQRQPLTVRKYQKSYLTYTLIAKNNQTKAIKLRMDIFTLFDPNSTLTQGSTFFLQPGFQSLSCSIPLTDSLQLKTVGAGNYTEFRLNFVDTIDGTADIDLYQIKCEFGRISTPLEQ